MWLGLFQKASGGLPESNLPSSPQWEKKMNMCDFNRKKYEDYWRDLNQELNTKGSLAEALLALEEQQFDAGFIQDDLKSVIRFRLHQHPHDRTHIFIVQYNPKRALRFNGAGRKIPPPESVSLHNGCFLCRDNIRWQQQGVEMGYDIQTNSGTEYIALMNPFPLMPAHTIIATREHVPQSWLGKEDDESERRFEAILHDLLELSSRLPDFFGFYNGIGAGATIPGHFHLQFFQRPKGLGPFPLEMAASSRFHENQSFPVVRVIKDYPITSLYLYGEDQFVIEKAVERMGRLIRSEYKEALSANIIATPDTSKVNYFHLYVVPRNRFYSHAPGMVSMIGGLEVLGEVVFSTEIEKQQLDTGQVDYKSVEQILAAVEPVGLESLIE
jgi:hypothetical protein